MTREEIRRLLISLLPDGSEDLYALGTDSYIGGTINALAGVFKETLTDRLDQLRLEVNPSTVEESIPDWEGATGLTHSVLALFGTDAQRRNAILSILREHGAFSLDDIRAAVQPYLNYADPSQIEIVEPDRAAQQAAHTYADATPYTATFPFNSASRSILVADDPRVSPAGAIVNLNLTGLLDEVRFRLTAPDGYVKNWLPGFLGSGSVTTETFTLFAPEMAGRRILGPWTLTVTAGGTTDATIHSWNIFVEGLGVNYDAATPPNRIGEGLGAALFEFLVIADPALLGTVYDIEGAFKAIQRVKPAHVLGSIVVKNTVMGGGLLAIPDKPTTLPSRSIPA